MHNADRYGLNAHEEIPDIQDRYAIPYDANDEKLANVKVYGRYAVNKAKIEKQKKDSQNRVKRNYRVGGLAVGGGIGYKIGSHYAKKTPIISQQRKRKLIGTAIGAAGGLAVGEGLAHIHINKRTNPKYQKQLDENEKWKEEAWRNIKKKFERRKRLNPIFRADPSPMPDHDYSDLGNYSPIWRHSKSIPLANKIIDYLKSKKKI